MISLPNIFKHFLRAAAEPEPYQFPDASDLIFEEEETESLPEPEKESSEEPAADTEELEEEKEEAPPEPDTENPIRFAQVQADSILRDARREAEQILEQTRAEALQEADQIRAAAREDGYQAGYADGVAQAMREGVAAQEKQAAALEEGVQEFLDQVAAEFDREMDQNVGELRDLALAVAEKVTSISLRSSGEVISRMIQAAIDKRKRREWVHIYIAECDAKRLGQIPAALTAALSALSNRVRIIPMADDESGTCIIEMPDEIIDASAATQLNNIRSFLMDTASSGLDGAFF